MLNAAGGRALAGALVTAVAAMIQAFLAARYDFRGPLHPLLLFVCPVAIALVIQTSSLGRLGAFLGLLLLSGATFVLTAEWLGTFS